MRAMTFWKTVTVDRTNMLENLISLLNDHGIRYCVIGGQGVNAYVEPLVSLDLDLVIAVEQLGRAESLLADSFRVERFPHTLNLSQAGSDLRVQIQTDPRYGAFVERATLRQILGLTLPVADMEDLMLSKIWAVQDPARRASKRQKDLADIARLLEAYPQLRRHVPQEILSRLV
jgi:hypothetical protein